MPDNKPRRRWSDNDRNFGPFTYAYGTKYRPLAMVFSSGDEEYEGAKFRISAFGHTLIVAMGSILKPERKWVDTSQHSWSKDPKDGYWSITPREYGFSLSEGFLNVSYGRASMDSSTEQRWGYFLPWTQWRLVRHSYFGASGEHAATLPNSGKNYRDDPGRWDREQTIKDGVPRVSFEFDDFDGQRIAATALIEEYEMRAGTGWFKWLSWLRKAKVRRSMDIHFSAETGKRKGSWKGGTIGHGIEMLPGELHEAAFRRYCLKHDMKFVGRKGGGWDV